MKKRVTKEVAVRRYNDFGFELIGEWINTKTPTIIKHMECGFIWSPKPNDIFQNHGCPRCSQQSSANKRKLTDEEVFEKFEAMGYELLGEYENTKTLTLIKHIECNFIWSPVPNSVFNGQGCPRCGKKSCADKLKLTGEEVFEKFEAMGYELLDEYENTKTPILAKHKECGFEWKVRANNIFSGQGCPQCATGKSERLVGRLLEEAGLIVDKQKSIKYSDPQNNQRRMYFDFYLPGYDVVIEYNGEQHYKPVCFGGINQERAEKNFLNQQVRDKNKQQYCDDNHIDLIWIDGRKYTGRKLENYVKESIVPKLKPTIIQCSRAI